MNPHDLDLAILDRRHLGVCAYGPLTRDEHDAEVAYERYCDEASAEYDAMRAAGGRTICPQCGRRTVKHGTAVTLGYEGHPGAEHSSTEECESCDYKDLA